MNLVYAALIATFMAFGLYLLLSRHVIRIMLGVMTLSLSVNLVIFLAGRIGTQEPALIPKGQTTLEANAANPLPQALVLTAVVIGFSLVAFLSALMLQTYFSTGTLDTREMDAAEALGSPFDDTEEWE